MAYYITELPNGKMLPQFGKAEILLTYFSGYRVNTPPSKRENDMVAIAHEFSHEAACWIDINRQYQICKMPDEREIEWLILPGIDDFMQKHLDKTHTMLKRSTIKVYKKWDEPKNLFWKKLLSIFR